MKITLVQNQNCQFLRQEPVISSSKTLLPVGRNYVGDSLHYSSCSAYNGNENDAYLWTIMETGLWFDGASARIVSYHLQQLAGFVQINYVWEISRWKCNSLQHTILKVNFIWIEEDYSEWDPAVGRARHTQREWNLWCIICCGFNRTWGLIYKQITKGVYAYM
jgi:hypothetical protein